MNNIFLSNLAVVSYFLIAPTLFYFWATRRWPAALRSQKTSETIKPFGLFNTLYALFLSMALVSLLMSFYSVQEDTRKEAEAVVLAGRASVGISDSKKMNDALFQYISCLIRYEFPAMKEGRAAPECSEAIDNLWKNIYLLKPQTANEIELYRTLVGELNDINKYRMSRSIRISDNLHPLVIYLIVLGYNILLIKKYLARTSDGMPQRIYEICTFLITISIIIVIVDLNTPYTGIINVDMSPFDMALERVKSIVLN